MSHPDPNLPSSAVPPLAAVRMQLVCGTDFSRQAAAAVEAAAALATHWREPLLLTHIVDEPARAGLPEEVRQSLGIFERTRLREETDRLRSSGVEVLEAFRVGEPAAVLVDLALRPQTRLVVLSSIGRKRPARWFLGSVAEHVAEAAPVPTLIIRDAAPFVAWVAGQRHLRVVVAADFSAASENALRWVHWLRQTGPCETVVTYLESPLPDAGGLIADPTTVVAEMLARTESVRHRSFRQHIRAALGSERVRVRLEKGWGHSDAHLIQMAQEERADLLVVGSHQRQGLQRLGHHSVSRGVLHYAPMNVACIPLRKPETGEPACAEPVPRP